MSLGLALKLANATLFKGVGVSLPAFMAGQSDGFWHDFTKTDRMFQEACGPTPAAVANDVIGLSLSQRLWNGQTLAAYLASLTNLASATSVAAVAIGGPAFTNYTIGSVVTGRTYQITFTVSGYSGSGTVGIGGGVGNYEPDLSGEAISANGTVTVYGTSSVTDNLQLFSRSTNTCNFTGISVKEVCRQIAYQSTAGFKPKVQTTGSAFDGVDDRELTFYAAGSGDNFVMLPKTTVPTTLAATQVLAGAMDVSANGFYIAITTGGALRVKVGSTTLDSTGVDLRNAIHDVGFWIEGSTLYLYADGAIVASGAWTGTRPSTAWTLGALNNNGTPGNFYGGSLKAALAGREALTLTRANQISAAY